MMPENIGWYCKQCRFTALRANWNEPLTRVIEHIMEAHPLEYAQGRWTALAIKDRRLNKLRRNRNEVRSNNL